MFVSLSPGRHAVEWQLWASCSHPCDSITKSIIWYWPMGGGWRSSAGKVTVDLAESNDSLPLGGWLKKSPVGWLPVHWDQLWAQRSVTSTGDVYFTFIGLVVGLYLYNLWVHWTSQTCRKATGVPSIVGKVTAGTGLHRTCNISGKSTIGNILSCFR